MKLDPSAVSEAVRRLAEGEVIGLPTETVYGLAADATNPRAVARIFEIKGRPSHHPLILHIASAGELAQWVRAVPPRAERLISQFWPGPLTLLLDKSERVPSEVTGGLSTVAVRVPAHPMALSVLRELGRPVAAPSANRFGSVSPTEAAHVLSDLGSRVAMVLDGGSAEVGLESTIVDLSRGEPRLVRPGGVSRQELEMALAEPVLSGDGSERAPGTLPSHYAPRAPLRLVGRGNLTEHLSELLSQMGASGGEKVGVVCFGQAPQLKDVRLLLRVLPPDLAMAARLLYSSLRALDAEGASVILSEVPPEDGIGLAMVDRLTRAAAPRS